MKLIKFKRDLLVDNDGDMCYKGKQYIISDGYLQQMKDSLGEETIEGIYPFREIQEKKYNGQDLKDKSLVVWRTGGMGDLCFITPNLRYIKETFKNSKIYFGCGPRFKYGMMHHPHIDKLIPLPIDYELIQKSDYYLMFEGIIENNPEAHRTSAYDLFSSYFGFTDKIEKEKRGPILGISDEHLKKHIELLKKHKESNKVPENIPIIGIGLRASHVIRSIIPSHIHNIMGLLINQGIMIALIGSKEDKDIVNQLPFSNHPFVLHCYKESNDYRDAIAQISLLDGVIGPDSSPIHIAAAFNKPIVGVYGPFPSQLRMNYYSNASGFDVKIPCGPCFLHGIETCDYSEPETKQPLCMHTHNPENIVNEMLTLLSMKKQLPTPISSSLKQI